MHLTSDKPRPAGIRKYVTLPRSHTRCDTTPQPTSSFDDAGTGNRHARPTCSTHVAPRCSARATRPQLPRKAARLVLLGAGPSRRATLVALERLDMQTVTLVADVSGDAPGNELPPRLLCTSVAGAPGESCRGRVRPDPRCAPHPHTLSEANVTSARPRMHPEESSRLATMPTTSVVSA
jgi:hypothetical protein